MNIRLGATADCPQIAAIYAPIVEQTHISFELASPGPEEMARRLASALKNHVWLVAETNGRIDGYAYASRYREKPAYAWSTETTIYVRDGARGLGVGKKLYRSLLNVLRAQNYRRAFAGIALPNDGSIALHESVGFTCVGVNPEAGYKLDHWHDLGWWSIQLNDGLLPPALPCPLSELGDLASLIRPA
jgi:phosphinothricin acetyltransferase